MKSILKSLVLVALGVSLSALPASAATIGWVVGVNGTPKVTRNGHTTDARRGKAIIPTDLIETDENSKVKLLFSDDSIMAIGPRSSVTIPEFTHEKESRVAKIKVLFGRFKINIAKFFGGPSEYEVTTPTAVAGVRGTILWGDTEIDAICSLEGEIEVSSLSAEEGAEPARLTPGNCVSNMGEGETVPLVPSQDALQGYLKEVTLE